MQQSLLSFFIEKTNLSRKMVANTVNFAEYNSEKTAEILEKLDCREATKSTLKTASSNEYQVIANSMLALMILNDEDNGRVNNFFEQAFLRLEKTEGDFLAFFDYVDRYKLLKKSAQINWEFSLKASPYDKKMLFVGYLRTWGCIQEACFVLSKKQISVTEFYPFIQCHHPQQSLF